MRKNLLLILTIFFVFTIVPVAFAASPTVAPTEKPSGNLNNQINQLKEKIASRVSELNLVEKRGVIGTIEEVSGNQITIRDLENKKRFIDVDELTKFIATGKGNFGLSDLTKGKRISIVGLYNKQSRRLLARFIRTSIDPTVITGTITAIDKQNFVVTIKTEKNNNEKIDINTITKIYNYSAEEIVKSGFSKLTIGQRLITIGFPDKKDPSLILASRVTVFPELASNPAVELGITPDASAGAEINE